MNEPATYHHTPDFRYGRVLCTCGCEGPLVRTGVDEIDRWAPRARLAWNTRYKEEL